MKNIILLIIGLLISSVILSDSLPVSSSYMITENITIYNGEIYNGWTTTGQHTRTLRSVLNTDSVVVTNLTVNPYTSKYVIGTTPNTVKPEDVKLFQLYLTYSNMKVLDTINIVGYSTQLVKSGSNLTQTIVINSHNNYNQYRFANYKNLPSTETRVPVMSVGKTIRWTKISYYVLQRKTSIEDFNLMYTKLPIFGVFPGTINVSDYKLYNQYLIYCNKMVVDTVYIVGSLTVPPVSVTYTTDLKDATGKIIRPKGTYLTQSAVYNSRINYNQYRFAKYKNIPSTETRVPTFPSGKVRRWIPITYYVLQRKVTDSDFAWYKSQIH